MFKKLKFGTYTATVEVNFQDEIDLDDHFTEDEWNKLTGVQQFNWLKETTKEGALGEMEYKFKLNK